MVFVSMMVQGVAYFGSSPHKKALSSRMTLTFGCLPKWPTVRPLLNHRVFILVHIWSCYVVILSLNGIIIYLEVK